MLWRTRSHPTVPRSAPVPDAQALRQAILQASWRRNRWVAQRRLAWRWLLWFGTRYALPVLAVAGLGAWLWLMVLPGAALPWASRTALAPAPSSQPPTAEAAQPHSPPAQGQAPDAPLTHHNDTDTEAAVLYSPEGEELPVPLPLRFEPQWAAAAAARTGSTTDSRPDRPLVEPFPHPTLQSENWLHSKEP